MAGEGGHQQRGGDAGRGGEGGGVGGAWGERANVCVLERGGKRMEGGVHVGVCRGAGGGGAPPLLPGRAVEGRAPPPSTPLPPLR